MFFGKNINFLSFVKIILTQNFFILSLYNYCFNFNKAYIKIKSHLKYPKYIYYNCSCILIFFDFLNYIPNQIKSQLKEIEAKHKI